MDNILLNDGRTCAIIKEKSYRTRSVAHKRKEKKDGNNDVWSK